MKMLICNKIVSVFAGTLPVACVFLSIATMAQVSNRPEYLYFDGIVVDDSSHPVEGASVSVFRSSRPSCELDFTKMVSEEGETVTTNAKGQFKLRIDTGSPVVDLSITSSHFVPTLERSVDARLLKLRTFVVTAKIDQVPEKSIEGVIKLPDGDPGAAVFLFPIAVWNGENVFYGPTQQDAEPAETNGDGTFKIRTLEQFTAVTVRIESNRAAVEYATVYPNKGNKIQLNVGACIQGKVIFQNRALPNLMVALRTRYVERFDGTEPSAAPSGEWQSITSSNGTFSFWNVPLHGQWYLYVPMRETMQTCVVTPKGIQSNETLVNTDVDCERGVSVSGVISFKHRSGALDPVVRLIASGTGDSVDAEVDQKGRFYFQQVSDGEYVIEALMLKTCPRKVLARQSFSVNGDNLMLDLTPFMRDQ